MQPLMAQSAVTDQPGAIAQQGIPPAEVRILPQSGGPPDSVLRNGYFNIQVVLPPGSKLPDSLTVNVKNDANIINNSQTVTLMKGGHDATGTVYSSNPITIDSGSAYTFDWITVKSGGTLNITYQDGGNGPVKSSFQVYDTALGQAVGRTENYLHQLQTQLNSTVSFADLTLALIDAGLKTAPCGSAVIQKLQRDRANVVNARNIATQKLDLINQYFRQMAYIASKDDLHLYLYTLQYKWNLASRLVPILLAPRAPDRGEVMDAWSNAANQANDEVNQIQLQAIQLFAVGLYQATAELTLAGPVFTLASPIFNKMTNGTFDGMTIWGTQAKGEDYVHAATSILIAAAMMKGVPAAVDAMGNTLAMGGDLRFSGGEFVVGGGGGGEGGEPVGGARAGGPRTPVEGANQARPVVNQAAGGGSGVGTGTGRYGVGEAQRLGVRGPQGFDQATFTDRMITDRWNGLKSEAAANPLDAAYVKILTAETQINEALRAFANNPGVDSPAARAAVANQIYSQYAAGVELARTFIGNTELLADQPTDVVAFLRNAIEPGNVVGPEHFRNALGVTEPSTPSNSAPQPPSTPPVINDNCNRAMNLGNQDGPGNTHVLRTGENPFAENEPSGPGRTQIIHPDGRIGQISPEHGPGSTQVMRQGENPFADGEPTGPGRTQILNPTTSTETKPSNGSTLSPDRPIFNQDDPTVFGGPGGGSNIKQEQTIGTVAGSPRTTTSTSGSSGTTDSMNQSGGPSTKVSETGGGTTDGGKDPDNGSGKSAGDGKKSGGSPSNAGASASQTFNLPPLPKCKVSISYSCSEFGKIAADLAVQAVIAKRDAEEQKLLGKPSADLFNTANDLSRESTEAWDRYEACLHLPLCPVVPRPGQTEIISPLYGLLGPDADDEKSPSSDGPTFNQCSKARDWMQRAERWRKAAERDQQLANEYAAQGLKDRAESAQLNVKMDEGEQRTAEQQAAYALRECDHKTTPNPPDKKTADSKTPQNNGTTIPGTNGPGGTGSSGAAGGSSINGGDSGKKDTGSTPKVERRGTSEGNSHTTATDGVTIGADDSDSSKNTEVRPTTEESNSSEKPATETTPTEGYQAVNPTHEIPVPPWFKVKMNPDGTAQVLPVVVDYYNPPEPAKGWWGINPETKKGTWHPGESAPVWPRGRWVEGTDGSYQFIPAKRIPPNQKKTVRLRFHNNCSTQQTINVSQTGFPEGMMQHSGSITVPPDDEKEYLVTVNTTGLKGQVDGAFTVTRKSADGSCEQSSEVLSLSFYITELGDVAALGSDVREGDYTAMDRIVREHLSSQSIDPNNWRVVNRNPDGSLTYRSAKTDDTFNARFSNGRVVIE